MLETKLMIFNGTQVVVCVCHRCRAQMWLISVGQRKRSRAQSIGVDHRYISQVQISYEGVVLTNVFGKFFLFIA